MQRFLSFQYAFKCQKCSIFAGNLYILHRRRSGVLGQSNLTRENHRTYYHQTNNLNEVIFDLGLLHSNMLERYDKV